MAGLLQGVRVIEVAQLMTGDFTGQLLADEGADVVKFESPWRGDYLRDFLGQMKPHTRGHGPMHLALNRNKRSVAVDLRTDVGKGIFWEALAQADVFLDGNTTGAMDKLGIGYDAQRAVKPDIVYAQSTGLGASGPYANIPTHGLNMSGLAGTEALRRDEHGYIVRDDSDLTHNIVGGSPVVMGPLYLAFGIASALLRRRITGQGAYLDVGASDAVLAGAWMSVVNMLNRDRIGADETGFDRAVAGSASSKYNFYETKDGKFVLAALIEHHFYEAFCKGLGREDLLEDGVGFVTKAVAIDWGPPSLRTELAEIFRTKTLAEWTAFAAEHDTVIGPAHQAADLLDDPHLRHREALLEYHHPTGGPMVLTGNPIKVAGEHYAIYRGAPALGQHTDEYLRQMGYDDDIVDRWRKDGVIGGAAES